MKGSEMRKRRIKLGFGLSRLADEAGVLSSTICAIEHDRHVYWTIKAGVERTIIRLEKQSHANR